MRLCTIAYSLFTLLAVPAATASAQSLMDRLGAEVRGSVNHPTGEFDAGADRGYEVGAALHLALTPSVIVYARYARAEFGIAQPSSVEGTWIDSGYGVGLRVILPSSIVPRAPFWIQAGPVAHRLSADADSPQRRPDREFGFEGGFGAELALGDRLALTPGVLYRLYSIDFPDEFYRGDIDSLAFGVGLVVRR